MRLALLSGYGRRRSMRGFGARGFFGEGESVDPPIYEAPPQVLPDGTENVLPTDTWVDNTGPGWSDTGVDSASYLASLYTGVDANKIAAAEVVYAANHTTDPNVLGTIASALLTYGPAAVNTAVALAKQYGPQAAVAYTADVKSGVAPAVAAQNVVALAKAQQPAGISTGMVVPMIATGILGALLGFIAYKREPAIAAGVGGISGIALGYLISKYFGPQA